MSLKGIAQETLRILEAGTLTTRSGQVLDFSKEQKAAEEGTKLYTPSQLSTLLQQQPPKADAAYSPLIEVTDETTQSAAHRLVYVEGVGDLALLNYASARNPGGGFINGAKAQEEDLARCSGLYPCQLQQPVYYDANRSNSSLLYTDHMIYSPEVPWFRVNNRELLDRIFLASVITAPAPNAGQVLLRDAEAWPEIEQALRRRVGYVLTVARDNGHRSLLLGAWGCGVFRNRAEMVADAFGQWLEDEQFRGCFDRVVFAVYDPSKHQKTLKAFQDRLQ